MAEQKTPHNEGCAGDAHNRHLCYLMYQGFHYSNREEYKALVQDAEFVCQNCGRTAKAETSLCAPIKL